MRRKDREMERTEAERLLAEGVYGVLSTADGNGQPYGIPLNYVYCNSAIYFHCARTGHKLDNLAANPRVSFCVVGRARVLPHRFSTDYESVVAFGEAREVEGVEKEQALVWLLEKYSPDHLDEGRAYLARQGAATKVIRIHIRHLKGKARK
ncbi:pyridoxamine 5'-phosphate oxidase family protein [Desulfacinum hydrothermale]|nr:pyridoxamine 5'-phosphate oxidase family protein [Desulfacinum hydrothermale]